MTATLASLTTDVQNRLQDVNAKFWSAAMITTWINEGLIDIARRAEVLEDVLTVPAVVGTRQYPCPTNMLRLHRVEFQVSTTNIYVMEGRTLGEMDSIWGLNQVQQQAYPSYYAIWGFVPNAKIYVYPSPSQSGQFNLWCYRLPATLVSGSDVAEVPEGWQSLVVEYCEYIALLRDNDPRYQVAQQIYETHLQSLIEFTRHHYDQQQYVSQGPMNSYMGYFSGNSQGWIDY